MFVNLLKLEYLNILWKLLKFKKIGWLILDNMCFLIKNV